MKDEAAHLAGVTRLALGGRGPREAYLFEQHRLALPCWAAALEGQRSALLVTLDRHRDLVPPRSPAPARASALRDFDTYARWELDPRNVDHILAAMDCGLLTDALVIARSSPQGACETPSWRDARGGEHRLLRFPTIESVCGETPEAKQARAALDAAPVILLDVDLDCFTSLSDADPRQVLAWPSGAIRDFLLPEGSEGFWDAVLPKCVALTLAKEAFHCGGVLESDRLFAQLAPILFETLLHADLP